LQPCPAGTHARECGLEEFWRGLAEDKGLANNCEFWSRNERPRNKTELAIVIPERSIFGERDKLCPFY
jgi:hypothetical protein